MDRTKLVAVIMEELHNICVENGIDNNNLTTKTMLFGDGSIIDSLALVGLVVKVEDFVMEETGKEIQVIDENAIISDTMTPFKNAETLADLALAKIQ
jgi:acyl carrier protein